jgi:hypothetical protein
MANQAPSALKEHLASAWKDYAKLTPDAPVVEELLRKRGENLVNDHVAYRTFNIPGIRRGDLGKIFEQWGYQRSSDELDFPDKKLKASYWLHDDPLMPKVFVSELELEKVSHALQAWIRSFAEPAVKKIGTLRAEHLLAANWEPVKFEDYERFYPESEYAAWTAAFGIRLNHFTVLVNSLKSFSSLQELNEFLQTSGFVLNASGGIVKGTPQEYLEQSSTMARKVEWQFAGSLRKPVLGCYYEFARRYEVPGTGRLFPGFIPKSADKIFESTFEKKE